MSRFGPGSVPVRSRFVAVCLTGLSHYARALMKAALIASLLFTTSAASAAPVVLSKTFDVCTTPVRGVRYQMTEGLDAASGTAKQGADTVNILIGRHPELPSGIKKPFGTTLASAIAYRGQTAHADGAGKVSLYAYGVGMVSMGPKPFQDQVLITIQADSGAANLALLDQVGRALVRCGRH